MLCYFYFDIESFLKTVIFVWCYSGVVRCRSPFTFWIKCLSKLSNFCNVLTEITRFFFFYFLWIILAFSGEPCKENGGHKLQLRNSLGLDDSLSLRIVILIVNRIEIKNRTIPLPPPKKKNHRNRYILNESNLWRAMNTYIQNVHYNFYY